LLSVSERSESDVKFTVSRAGFLTNEKQQRCGGPVKKEKQGSLFCWNVAVALSRVLQAIEKFQ